MTRRTIRITMAAAAVAAFAGSTSDLAAQREIAAVTAPTVRADKDRTPPSSRAEELRAEAEALFTQPARWRKAARLMEQSAQLRDAADPEAYTCWIFAGRLRSALNDHAGARAALEKAAAQALARGAVLDAAQAYIDAAFVAKEERQVEIAQELLDRASLLATSPQLSSEQVELITRRIGS